MSKSQSLKVGSILSEFQIYRVAAIGNNTIDVKDGKGNIIELPKRYADEILMSADFFDKIEKKTVTEMADIVTSNPRIAMTVGFTKKGKELSQKAYKAKIDEAVTKFKDAKVSELESLVTNLINNPISKTEAGAFREIKGISLGNINTLGRIDFMDYEESTPTLKQVDPRTIEYVILNGTKYELK